MRIVVAGAVSSTRLTLEALIRHEADVVGVLQMRSESSHTVTGFDSLDDVAGRAGIPCVTFRNINDDDVVTQVREWQPDLMFVVGLSQLVREELMAIPRLGSVGFHPTFLPAGRGRAPLAWLTLDGGPGAASFFLIDDGIDSGPIFVQEPFEITPDDYASDVGLKLLDAMTRALDRWLPELLAGQWDPKPQSEALATCNGRRGPDDGLIDWTCPAVEIHTLIRAASVPHPGAYTWVGDRRLIVWRAERETRLPWRGVPGRVLLTDATRGALVQTGDGLLWLTETAWADETESTSPAESLRVGTKLGLVLQDEVAALKSRVAALEARLARLEG
ncbi:MAG: methionyl-tRNA formyltransferase [Planctomycetota bacterium]|jgi:methionyl-tRNA formyltransferase